MGIYRLPGTKYWVINPNEFQEWFNNWIGANENRKENEGKRRWG